MRAPRSHLHNCHLEPIFYRVNGNPNKLDQSLTVCSTIEDLTIVRTKRIRGGFIRNQASMSQILCGASSRLECGQKITREQWVNLCSNFFLWRKSGVYRFIFEVYRLHKHTKGQDSSERVINRWQGPLPTQHTSDKGGEHPCPQRDSKQQSQQSSGWGLTRYCKATWVGMKYEYIAGFNIMAEKNRTNDRRCNMFITIVEFI